MTITMAVFRLALSVCILCLCACRASSSPSKPNGIGIDTDQGLNKDAAGDVERDEGSVDGDAIEPILSQLSSWMKEKRKQGGNKRRQEFDEDLQGPRPSNLPFVTLAYAQTLDGMIAARLEDETTTSNLALSGPQSKVLTHRLRNLHDAILVGGSTFLLDQPQLNVRLPREHVDMYEIDHPIPVVLDTHLRCLQTLLFGSVVDADPSFKEDIPDIAIDTIRAGRPVICCSSPAAVSFLDVLEVFQEQQFTKRKPKKSYKITVYKKIDEDDPTNDIYQPIKISMRVTQYRKHGEDVVEEVTLTLLPCLTDERTKSVSLRHMLTQLSNQYAIESVMVEGGAGVLSSFLMNESVSIAESDGSDEESSGKVVDCICATIAPKIIGGRWGLPSFGGLNLPWLGNEGPEKDGEEPISLGMRMAVAIKDGTFVPLGQDCAFLGRI